MITATAALVAIIGGFLVSRVITLSGEKNSIMRRLREIENELNKKKEMLDRIEDILIEEEADDFILEHAEDILVEEKPIKEMLEEDESVDLTEEELHPYLEKLKSIHEELIDIINNTEDDYILPNSFEDFTKDNNLKIKEKKEWYEKVYWVILNYLPEEPTNFLGINPRNLIDPSLIKPIKPDPVIQDHFDRIKERNKLEDEIQILIGIKEEQKKILEEYGQVSGLWGGLAVLIYACVVGIVIPSTLLPYPTGIYDDVNTKRLLLSLFFSELVVLFIYLGYSMYKLTKRE